MIAVVEVVNSSGIQIQANGAVPSITVDKTSGVTTLCNLRPEEVSDDVRYVRMHVHVHAREHDRCCSVRPSVCA